MVTQRAPRPESQPRSGKEPRQPGHSARPSRAARSRRVIMVSGVAVIAVVAGACTAGGRPGGYPVRTSRATAASPAHRSGQVHSVQLVVEASGDLLIHSPIFERALVLGGGRSYNFAPMFAEIKPYIRGADLTLCHVETPMTPAAPTGYPTFNTPPALATAEDQRPLEDRGMDQQVSAGLDHQLDAMDLATTVRR